MIKMFKTILTILILIMFIASTGDLAETYSNMNKAPLFANPENGDYHLKSQSGRWDGTGWG
jgi:hypothetical protein